MVALALVLAVAPTRAADDPPPGQPAEAATPSHTSAEQAQSTEPADQPAASMPSPSWEEVIGEWGGARTWLRDRGLDLDIRYTADFFQNTRGGLNTNSANQYRGLFKLGMTLDSEKLGLWKDGTLHVSMTDNRGTDISARHVGDLQALNCNDAPNATRLYEFWYEQRFLDDRLQLKLGRMDANADFAAPDYGGEFVHCSAYYSPTIPLPLWPDTALGVSIRVEPVEWLYLAAGLYDAHGRGTRTGFDTAFHGPDDSVTMFELGLRPKLNLFGQEGMPGTYRVGGFYHGGEWDVFFNDLGGRLQPRQHRGNAGLYLVFDQLVFREAPADDEDEQGLGMFFQFGWVPSACNEISQHYGGGLQYVGLLPRRGQDVCGVGLHHVSLGGAVQALESRYSETAVEVFYKVQVTDFFSIKPDVQYIVNPGGRGKDALVAGVRLEFCL